MPRTPSSTTILLTAAAAFAATASGCVSVRATPTTPKTHSPSASAPAPRPEGHAEHPVVQAPAREALEQLKPTTPQHAPARHPEQPQQAAAPTPPRTAPKATPAPRLTTAPEPRTAPELRHVKKVPKAPAQTNVCALGRRYGGWDPDSPQSVICRDTYGG
ncbi:hypothetical protein OG785_30815 [Streptomyces sp. NBC_00006]|uniref:hypothetical protein n=1 Tax=Streptomyces sp. NBC_00006 TaxID=2975619 RepID=UPI002258E0CD|nr:hypothetical protein [Streptomyces sp. NBC_00006]MCX5534930.1 hypothetical protein [Streptomyces sp. NBC_00006]